MEWRPGGDARSSVLVVTKWLGDDGKTRFRVLAADRPDAHELNTDSAGALAWVSRWIDSPPAGSA